MLPLCSVCVSVCVCECIYARMLPRGLNSLNVLASKCGKLVIYLLCEQREGCGEKHIASKKQLTCFHGIYIFIYIYISFEGVPIHTYMCARSGFGASSMYVLKNSFHIASGVRKKSICCGLQYNSTMAVAAAYFGCNTDEQGYDQLTNESVLSFERYAHLLIPI